MWDKFLTCGSSQQTLIIPTKAAAPHINVLCDYFIQSNIPMRLGIHGHMLPTRRARLRKEESSIQDHIGSRRTRTLTQVCLALTCQTVGPREKSLGESS